MEAHNTISAIVCLAVGAGIHGSIRTDEQREQPAEGLLALSPADAVENLERVNLWYALVLCETSIGLSTGLPSSVPADVCGLLVSVEHVLSFTLILSSIVPP